MTIKDFLSRRPYQKEWDQGVLRPGVIAHHYDGHVQQYVLYLPEQNIFYVAGYGFTGEAIPGPFVGDPRVVFAQLAGGNGVK